jgi:hypothetical protein
MGHGSVSDPRWQPDRKLSAEERANFWQSKYLQQRSEMDFLGRENVALRQRIDQLEKLLFFTPGDKVQR